MLLGLARRCGFPADGRDGSVLKEYLQAGISFEQLEEAIYGTALTMLRQGERSWSMRILKTPARELDLPFFRRAQNAYYEHVKQVGTPVEELVASFRRSA